MKLTKSLAFVTNKSITETKSNFTDLKKYVCLHPLMLKTDLVETATYKLYEQPFAWLPLRITYFANVIENKNNVTYLIMGIPLTKARFDYTFVETGPISTTIDLTIQLNGLPLVNHIIMKLMIDAQHTIFEKLNQQ